MEFYIVIPVHNEEQYIERTFDSLVSQTLLPKKIVVVNDASSDRTWEIIEKYEAEYPFIKGIYLDSEKVHQPGSKVIRAFYEGYKTLDDNWDVLCKFDGDLIFPPDYLEVLAQTFQTNPKVGIAGGFCYIKKNESWQLENLTGKDHVRGALKAYKKGCFEQIGKLKPAMGWDTIDELLARFHEWEIATIPALKVKHLKQTGKVYTKKAKYKQGEAFYRMRYGFLLTAIASGKLAFRKKSLSCFSDSIKGFFLAKKNLEEFLVTEEEGKFIRNFRWKNIQKKLLS